MIKMAPHFILLFLLVLCKREVTMSKLESKFQKDLIDEIKSEYPGCMVLKNDSGYIQGIPDWTVLYKNKWAMLEAKRDKKAKIQPNQPHYVETANNMSFSRFVYPENKEEVLNDLREHFRD